MDTLIKTIQGIFSTTKASDFQARSNISLSVFQETIDNLEMLNGEAVGYKKRHEEIIVESTNEVKTVDLLVDKNLRVIEKIKDIIN